VLFRVHVEAMIATMGRKRAERYLRAMAEKLAWEEGLASVFHIRPIAQHAEVRRTRQQASAIFERMLPVFLAAIPREVGHQADPVRRCSAISASRLIVISRRPRS
jgi:hypothetical protein